MIDSDRRPTAQEIEELIDLVRRDPSSPAFVQLGEAYLALGRPRDAMQVGNLGLEAAPDNMGGRVMLARAYAAMHQWKEAQGELLRVVKVDRGNRVGFALLGEVLMRRSDFDRAVPVLQHAQNLDPTSPQILAMLRRARNSQPLDAPAPIPQPVPPRGETDFGMEQPRSARAPAPQPPPMARPAPGTQPPPVQGLTHALNAPPPMTNAGMGGATVPTASPAMSTLAIKPNGEYGDAPPSGYNAPASSFQAPAPSTRSPNKTAPPPMSVEGVRPRIVAATKVQNAAKESLRQSAAVGETYLNDLLTGGLLDVAGVRVPDAEFDLRPDRRWGRSTRRAFIFLFVILIFGIGGGGTWYWWEGKQQAEAVRQLLVDAKAAMQPTDAEAFANTIELLGKALDKNNKAVVTKAYYAEAVGLDTLLYARDGTVVGKDALDKIGEIKPEQQGYRETVIARAALNLANLHAGNDPAGPLLKKTSEDLDAYLAKHEDDRWAKWLKGRVLVAGGDPKAAAGLFESAGDGDNGLVLATIDRADLLVDEGKLEAALELYKVATAKTANHPLAIVGRSLGRAEASFEIDDTIGELNDRFVESKIPPRVAAYRNLALALANISIEDYPKARESLIKATGGMPPREPRFWSRVAWVYYLFGDMKASGDALDKTTAYGAKADAPTVQLVLAATALSTGLPDQALTTATKIEGVRPRVLRTYALLDLGKYAEAQKEIEAVIAQAPQNVEAKILREQARALGNEKERAEALEELERLGRRANSKLGRHSLGVTKLALGDIPGAQEQLELAMTDVSDTSPNPLAYRTLTAIAQLELAKGDLMKAGEALDKALDLNPIYFPTLALQAQIVLRNKQPDRALQLLEPILKEGGAVTIPVQLTFAEVLILRTGSTAEDKAQARKIITDLVGKAPDAELFRIATLLDPGLPAELQLPNPADPGGATAPAPATPAPAPPPKKKGRRR